MVYMPYIIGMIWLIRPHYSSVISFFFCHTVNSLHIYRIITYIIHLPYWYLYVYVIMFHLVHKWNTFSTKMIDIIGNILYFTWNIISLSSWDITFFVGVIMFFNVLCIMYLSYISYYFSMINIIGQINDVNIK